MTAAAELREMRGLDEMRGWVEVHNRIFAAFPTNAADEQVYRDLDPRRLDVVALVAGEPVGIATTGRIFEIADSTNGHSLVGVLPAFRRRGVGSLLLDAISRRARASGLDGHQMATLEDEQDGIGYLERRGFRIVQRAPQVGLELATATAADQALPSGVRITTLAAEPQLVRGVYEVALEAQADMPLQFGEPTPGSFEQWHAIEVTPDSKPHEAFFVAVEDGRPVGYAALWLAASRPDAAWHAMTGVARAARGRGVALALKHAQIAWARANGIAWLITMNEETNAPMRHINARLGYRTLPAALTLHGPLVFLDGSREP